MTNTHTKKEEKMVNISHEFTDEIVCPHCGYTNSDSHEFGDDGKEECEECGKEYPYSRNTEITYSTSSREDFL